MRPTDVRIRVSLPPMRKPKPEDAPEEIGPTSTPDEKARHAASLFDRVRAYQRAQVAR